MEQYGLTAKQLKLFKFIKSYIGKNTVSPSYEEMMVAVQLKSKNSINKYVSQLEDRKWIKKLPGKARSIQILK